LGQGLQGQLPQVICTNWSQAVPMTMTVKVLLFEWASLKAALYWCNQFQDLIELKGLDAAAKFMNANIRSYLWC
jgi:hypothetical protein